MNDTHSKVVAYILWIFGFMGAHRFYYGRPISGTIYFFTLGLFLIGWFVDLFLIPSMEVADRHPVFVDGRSVSIGCDLRLLDLESTDKRQELGAIQFALRDSPSSPSLA